MSAGTSAVLRAAQEAVSPLRRSRFRKTAPIDMTTRNDSDGPETSGVADGRDAVGAMACAAQQCGAGAADVRGTVVDGSGAPIAGAALTARGRRRRAVRMVNLCFPALQMMP